MENLPWLDYNILTNPTTKKRITVEQRLKRLNKNDPNNNYSISIYHDGEYKDTENLKEYYGREITGIFCSIDKNGDLQYEVAVESNDTSRQKQMIESLNSKANSNQLISVLTNFNFEEKGSGKIILRDNVSTDEGDEYHITPKKGKDITVGYLKSVLKAIPDDNVYLFVDSTKFKDIGPYKKLKDIPKNYNDLEITGGSILFGKKGIYCNVSSGFNPEQDDGQEFRDLLNEKFNLELVSEPNAILHNGKEDSGISYNITPKDNTTVIDFINRIKETEEKIGSNTPINISIDCPGLENTADYQDINGDLNLQMKLNPKLKRKQKSYNIKDQTIGLGNVTFGKNGIYIAINILTPEEINEIPKQSTLLRLKNRINSLFRGKIKH